MLSGTMINITANVFWLGEVAEPEAK